jgi:hypothetical protein
MCACRVDTYANGNRIASDRLMADPLKSDMYHTIRVNPGQTVQIK